MSDVSPTIFPIQDAHLHLADLRIRHRIPEILGSMTHHGIVAAVSNATSSQDWAPTLQLARAHPWITPAIGLHPWNVADRERSWFEDFRNLLNQHPQCTVGEIGLDKCCRSSSIGEQRTVFAKQWEEASMRKLPVTIHCVKAWGSLADIVWTSSGKRSGFLLHDYSGPIEQLERWILAGAFFSISPKWMHEQRYPRAELLRHIPRDRMLIETDAPNLRFPALPDADRITGEGGNPLQHPTHLRRIFAWLANSLQWEASQLSLQLTSNFEGLFGIRNSTR